VFTVLAAMSGMEREYIRDRTLEGHESARKRGKTIGGAGVTDTDEAPLVYVTFGTMAGRTAVGDAAFRAALDAVRSLPSCVLLTVGRATDIQALGDVPASVHVEAWVPQADALAGATAVAVCHGGSQAGPRSRDERTPTARDLLGALLS
jgi:UDP:flavonoid glycosyltransferase YjiC (YdhE family)